MRSMTGYGRAVLELPDRSYQIEIKSVNHKYCDINVKMPRNISYLEEEVKKYIQQNISRGKIDVSIVFENNSSKGVNVCINKELATQYIEELKQLAKENNINSEISVMEIAQLPDVLNVQKIEEDDTIKEEIKQCLELALDKFVSMRKTEGSKIEEDLNQRIDKISKEIEEISAYSTGLVEEYVVKLEGRIKEILKTDVVDKDRLAQEIVIYSDKCSVEEELTRLKSHVSQFKELICTDEAIGKKIDFLIQEMNRETNTIGSKANNLNITKLVIEIKTRIRRHKRANSKYRVGHKRQ